MPATPRLVARRTTLALGAVGLVACAGCDNGDDRAPADPFATPASHSDTDRDAALVDEILTTLASITGLVAKVGTAYPKVASPMTALRRMHDLHTEALGGTPAIGPATGRVFTDASAALMGVRREEQALQRRLVDAALNAESGRLARLLASMSAAVAQRLTVVPGGPA